MNTGDTIKKLRKERHMTQLDLAHKLDVAPTTVSSWERGAAYPLMTTAKAIAGIFGVPVSTIAGEASAAPISTASHSYPYIPADIAAGTPTTVDAIMPDDVETIDIPDAVMGNYAGDKDVVLMHINGESMNRVMPDGSLIAVQKIDSANSMRDDDIVVFACDGEYSVKRFYNDRNARTYVFNPDSDARGYHPISYRYEDADTLTIVGKVITYVVNL